MRNQMATFIEQKANLKQEIEELERENCRLFDTIDKNEHTIAELEQVLAEIGTRPD